MLALLLVMLALLPCPAPPPGSPRPGRKVSSSGEAGGFVRHTSEDVIVGTTLNQGHRLRSPDPLGRGLWRPGPFRVTSVPSPSSPPFSFSARHQLSMGGGGGPFWGSVSGGSSCKGLGLGLPREWPHLGRSSGPSSACSSPWSSFEAAVFIFFNFLSRFLYRFSWEGGSASSTCLSQKQDRK